MKSKSLDVSKAIDKQRDDYPAIRAVVEFIRVALAQSGKTRADLEAALGGSAIAAHFLAPSRSNAGCPTWEQWETLRGVLGFDPEMDAEVWRLNGRKGTPGEAWERREVVGVRSTGIGTGRGAVAYIADSENRDITAPATPEAERWQGWGTALKPSYESIVVARKPLIGTVAQNVLAHGTGGINVDATRVAHGDDVDLAARQVNFDRMGFAGATGTSGVSTYKPAGRWPANLVLSHDETCSDVCAEGCPVAEMDAQSGPAGSNSGRPNRSDGQRSVVGEIFSRGPQGSASTYDTRDSGGASRFFPVFRYQAKAPSSERPKIEGSAAHPTVKPLALMRWLVRLVTPPGGTVLDCFAGSGTTVEAAVLEGFDVIGIEREADYLPLIEARLARAEAVLAARPVDPPSLFKSVA